MAFEDWFENLKPTNSQGDLAAARRPLRNDEFRNLQSLVSNSPLLQQLAPFFAGGILFKSRAWKGETSWWLTAWSVLSDYRELTLESQIEFNNLIPKTNVGTCFFGRAEKLLPSVPLVIPNLDGDARAMLFRPTEDTALILISETPVLWAQAEADHVLKLLSVHQSQNI